MPPKLRSSPLVWLLAAGLASAAGLRAQVTEAPQTMGFGRAQVRMEAISLGVAPDTSAPNQYKALGLGTLLVSAGLTNTVDLQVGTQLYVRETFSSAGTDQTRSGLGSITVRPKWTFWSDPSSGQQAAIIPYVILPSHSGGTGSKSAQGGIILPWSADLPAGAKAAAMLEWDALRNEADTRYDSRLYGSAYAKWALGQLLSAYAETTLSESTAGSSTLTGTVGGGATLSLSKNFEWDYEIGKVVGPGRNSWVQILRFRWRLF